jgi:hypothetical protein
LKTGLFCVDGAEIAIRITTQYIAATDSITSASLPANAFEQLSQFRHDGMPDDAVIYLFAVRTALGRLYFATFDATNCAAWIASLRSWFGHVSLNYGEPTMTPPTTPDLHDLYDRLECIVELMLAPVTDET